MKFSSTLEKNRHVYKKRKDYFTGGMLLPNRNSSSNEYRYGFNGMEKDDEINNSEGTNYTANYWQYDSRIMRRWNRDPVVKHHESPYAAFANSPIWIVDPSGADSTLNAGSRVWNWTTEKGDTYESISKRTGVPIEDLRYFNQDLVVDDHKIPTGAQLYLSDPTCSADPSIPMIEVKGEGSIQLHNFDETANGWKDVSIIADFTPDGEGEYRWWQTFQTNDPITYNPDGSQTAKAPDRVLGPVVAGNDIDAGVRAFNAYENRLFYSKIDGQRYPIKRSNSNSVGFLDRPHRSFPTSTGSITWQATLTLQKKVGASYVTTATYSYGFRLHSDGSFEITPFTVVNETNK